MSGTKKTIARLAKEFESLKESMTRMQAENKSIAEYLLEAAKRINKADETIADIRESIESLHASIKELKD